MDGRDAARGGEVVLWAAGAIYLCGEAGGYLLPLILESVARTFSISEAAVGPIMALKYAAFAVAAIGLAPWLGTLSPRRGATLALGLIVLGNLLSAAQPALATLIPGRLLVGLGEGSAAAVATAMLARSADPDRAFARVLFAVVLMAMLMFLTLPELMAGQDARLLFLGIALLPLLALPAIPFLSDRVVIAPGRERPTRGPVSIPALMVCVALALFSLSANAYWVYLERIATGIGMTPTEYGRTFAAAAVFALAGPTSAHWLGARQGRMLPLFAACILVGGAGFLATHAQGAPALVTGVTVSSAALMFGIPYFLGLAADLDPAGRIAAAARGFAASGSALAPAAAGGILGLTGAYTSIGWVSLLTAGAALLLVLSVSLRENRTPAPPEEVHSDGE